MSDYFYELPLLGGSGGPTLWNANIAIGGAATITASATVLLAPTVTTAWVVDANSTLGNGNRDWSGTINGFPGGYAHSNNTWTTGKKYYEFKFVNAPTAGLTVGIADAVFAPSNNYLGGDAGGDSVGFAPGDQQEVIYTNLFENAWNGTPAGAGTFCSMAVDWTNHLVWFLSDVMVAAGKTWNGWPSGAADPAAGTNGVSFTFSGVGRVRIYADATGDLVTLNAGADAWHVSPPAGFTGDAGALTNASASIAGIGTVRADGRRLVPAAATVTSVGSIGTSGTISTFHNVGASIAGGATLTVPATRQTIAGSVIAGSGAVMAPAILLGVAGASRTGVSVIAVNGTNESPGQISLIGNASVSVAASLAGSSVGIIGAGHVSVSARATESAAISIVGSGTVASAASHSPTAAVSINGSGALGALALGAGQQSGSSRISGAVGIGIGATHTPAGAVSILGAASVGTDGSLLTRLLQAGATISGASSISSPVGQRQVSAAATIQVGQGSFPSDFSSDFSSDFGSSAGSGSASGIRVAATEIAQARATISGVGGLGANATGGTIGATARIAGVATVAPKGAATMFLATQTIAGTGTVSIAPQRWVQASVRIAGIGGFGSNATRAAAQQAAQISGAVSVGANAGVLRTADPAFAVIFHVGVDAKLGTAQGVDVPTEAEFDALSAEVAALETSGVSSVIYAGQPFYCVEITAGRGATSVNTPTRGYGTRPHGTVARRTAIVQSLTKVLASDMGYRTGPLDPDGVIPYPPLVQTAFTISRHINIDPTMNAIGASWGSVILSNAKRVFDGIAASWNNDGRDLVIKRGVKTFDPDRGYYVDPPLSSLTTIFQGLSTQWTLDEQSLSVPLIDIAYWLSRPYQSAHYGGTGSYDGSITLRGLPIPRTRGGTAHAPVHNVSPTLLDTTNRIYQYSDAPGGVVRLYENGGAVFGYAGDVTNLYSGSTPPGQYRTDNSRSLFQMGSVPVGQITADVTGEFPVAGPITNAAQIIYYMLTEDISVPETYLDAASFAEIAFGAGSGATRAAIDRGYGARPRGTLAKRTVVPSPAEGASAVGGLYFDSSSSTQTGLTAISAMLNSIGAHILPTRTGLLKLFLLRALDPNAKPTVVLDKSVLVGLTPQPMPANLLPMPYRFRVGYAHNYTVQSMVGSVLASDDQRQFMALSDRYATWISASVQNANLRPNDPNPVGGGLLEFEAAQGVANAHGALWGTRRRVYNAEMPVALALQLDMGDVVSTVFPMDDLSNGRLGQIIGEDFVSTMGTATLQILV